MKNIFLSLFAIALATIAAMAATTAMLNTPVRVAPAYATAKPQEPQGSAAQAPPATSEGAASPTPPPAGTPPASASGGAPSAAPAGAGAADAKEDEEPDKDPYEGINPEELPPDLQYNADSSVSFPTNI